MLSPHIIAQTLTASPLPDASRWRRIGGGVWGDVFDLGDGTALKLVRHTGGIGSGVTIFDGEVQALARLNGLGGDVRTARLVASGLVPQGRHQLAHYYGWIRMSILPGVRASAALADATDEQARNSIMQRIGAAAAQFQMLSIAIAARHAPLPNLTHVRLAQIAEIVPDMAAACAEVEAVFASGAPHPFLHGDINAGNVLLADGPSADTGPHGVGFVDLGEAQAGCIEVELRHAHDLGGPPQALIDGYCAAGGPPPDPHRLAAAFALNALGTLAIATLGTVKELDADAARDRAKEALKALG